MVYEGEIYDTTKSGMIEVLEYRSCHDVLIVFLDTGNETTTTGPCIEAGTVMDRVAAAEAAKERKAKQKEARERRRMTPSKEGRGFIGLGKYHSGTHPREHRLWGSIFTRCYNERALARHPTYKGCEVDRRWWNFQNFCEDLPSVPNYDKWKSTSGMEYHFDKDIRIKGNRVYRLEAVSFVPVAENSRDACDRRDIDYLRYALITPKGEKISIRNLRAFCLDNGLNYMAMIDMIKGRQETHKGWRAPDQGFDVDKYEHPDEDE